MVQQDRPERKDRGGAQDEAEDVKPPFKCYIYCTKERSKMGWLRIVPGKGWQRLDGTVIGEFVCDKIWELAPICRAPDDVEEMACMDRTALSAT